MTANALPEQVRAFRRAGMDDYVAKPFRQQELHDAIRRVMNLPTNMKGGMQRPALDMQSAAANARSAICR